MNSIIEGDVLEVLRSLPREPSFDCVIADPPYNHGIWMRKPVDEHAAWCEEWLLECMARLREGGLLYCYGWPETLAHVAVRFPVKKQRWLQWHYTNKTSPKSTFWQRSHESILALWNNEKPVLEVDQVREEYSQSFKRMAGGVRAGTRGRFGSGKTTTYSDNGGALPRDVMKVPALAGGCRDKSGHPSAKPEELTERLLRAILRDGVPGDVLVPFAGSGSECMVAQSMGHRYLGIELDAQWVRLARESLAARKPML